MYYQPAINTATPVTTYRPQPPLGEVCKNLRRYPVQDSGTTGAKKQNFSQMGADLLQITQDATPEERPAHV